MKKLVLFTLLAVSFGLLSDGIYAQVAISETASPTPDGSALLDLQSTSKGFLFPRMLESQKNAISSPATGLVVFQTNNTPGFFYYTGSSWLRITDASTIGGYWSPDGNNIYFNTGNVGIGNDSPSSTLDIVGDVYINGSPGSLEINARTGNEPILNFGYEGSSVMNLNLDNPGPNAYLSVSSDIYSDVWGVSRFGRVIHQYFGSGQAYLLYSSADVSTLYIDNDNPDAGARGINCAITDNSAVVDETLAIGGWNLGEGEGVYGQQGDPLIGDYPNFGYLGTLDHGAYGEFQDRDVTRDVNNRGLLGSSAYGAYGAAPLGSTIFWGALGVYDLWPGNNFWGIYGSEGAASDPNFGGIGTDTYGVYGEYNSEDFFGALGADNAGVIGVLGGSSQDLDDGDYAIIGQGVFNSSESGSGYSAGASIGGVQGYNGERVPYGFGVAGYTSTSGATANRTGGVLGYYNSNVWGSLGYRSSGSTNFGLYANGGSGAGSGKSQGNVMCNIGLGSYGDLFGAHISGAVYGLYTEGEDYGLYSHGDTYRTGADVHLQQDDSGQNNVMYTLVSPEMTIQTYGVGQLSNGKANIQFDAAFSNVVSDSEPIVITVTPIGESEGVHIEQVDGKGFRVAENRSGKSSVQFSWIAIGKRVGYENLSLPEDVISIDYDERINRGLSRDVDLNASGEGLYYQNGKLYTGKSPERISESVDVKTIERLNPVQIDEKNLEKLDKEPVKREAAKKETTEELKKDQ